MYSQNRRYMSTGTFRDNRSPNGKVGKSVQDFFPCFRYSPWLKHSVLCWIWSISNWKHPVFNRKQCIPFHKRRISSWKRLILNWKCGIPACKRDIPNWKRLFFNCQRVTSNCECLLISSPYSVSQRSQPSHACE